MQPRTIGKSRLAWPLGSLPTPASLTLALSLDPDRRSNQETAPEKTPSQIKWLKHLLGIYTLCRLSSPPAALTGGLSLFYRGDQG